MEGSGGMLNDLIHMLKSTAIRLKEQGSKDKAEMIH